MRVKELGDEEREGEFSSRAEFVTSWHHDNDKQAALSEFETLYSRVKICRNLSEE
jgi:hypothetical protein